MSASKMVGTGGCHGGGTHSAMVSLNQSPFVRRRYKRGRNIASFFFIRNYFETFASSFDCYDSGSNIVEVEE